MIAEEALAGALRHRCRGASWQGLARELAWRAVTGGQRDARRSSASRRAPRRCSLRDRSGALDGRAVCDPQSCRVPRGAAGRHGRRPRRRATRRARGGRAARRRRLRRGPRRPARPQPSRRLRRLPGRRAGRVRPDLRRGWRLPSLLPVTYGFRRPCRASPVSSGLASVDACSPNREARTTAARGMPGGVHRGRCRSFPQRRLAWFCGGRSALWHATVSLSESAHPRRHGRLPQTRRLDRGRGLPGLSGLPRTEQGERVTICLPADGGEEGDSGRPASDRSPPSEPRASTPGGRADAKSAPLCVVRFASCDLTAVPPSEREGTDASDGAPPLGVTE